MRLGVVTSHPIQYQAPLFRALAKRVDLKVYFAHRATAENQAEAGFGENFDWDVDLIGGFAHAFLENASLRPGITKFSGCDTPSIAAVLAADRPDVLVVYGWHLKTYLQAAKAAHARGIPVMARTDSHLDTPRSLVTRAIKTFIHPIFLRRFDMFLASGSRSAHYLRHYRVPESRIRIVPYCVDTAAFAAAAARGRTDRKRLRAQYGAADDEKIVLFVGKLVGLKGIPLLMAASSRLFAAGHAVRLLVVGSGPLAGELAAMAKNTKLPVTFVGFVNQTHMPAIYAAADLLVLPSNSETWGLVVNEAFACGVPAVVSNRVGCAPDMIVEGLTGSVVPVGDVDALAAAIARWIGQPDMADTRHALADVTGRYSPEASAEAFAVAADAAGSVYQKAAS
jgi:glycosyltransferase involved in cell wall biosynthesis